MAITGSCSAKQRMAAVDRFQSDPNIKLAVCNIIAGGVGITLTAGTHVIFQDLDWVPANHMQAEDRCYRLGQEKTVTVEYFHAAGSLDEYIAELLSRKMQLIAYVEAEELPSESILAELQDGLRRLAPALLAEARLAREGVNIADQVGALALRQPDRQHVETPLESTGAWEFPSERDPSQTYSVTFGRAGHLECTCKGFEFRGNCKHVRQVRAESLA